MAPLLVSALVGIGVKIATDLLMSGAKQIFKASGATTSFAAALDKARETAPAAGAGDVPQPVSFDATGSDRARALTASAAGGPPPASRALGIAAYQRLDDIPPQAV